MLSLRSKINLLPLYAAITPRYYAKVAPAAAPAVKGLGKKIGKVATTSVEKKIMPVEQDPKKLVNYVCGSNYFVEGEDVKVKPDSEYPEWLWTLHTGPPLTLDQLDPNTKEYWKKLRQMALNRNLVLRRTKKF